MCNFDTTYAEAMALVDKLLVWELSCYEGSLLICDTDVDGKPYPGMDLGYGMIVQAVLECDDEARTAKVNCTFTGDDDA